MVAQALLRVHTPPLVQGRQGEIDGRLGTATARALVRLTRGCGHLGQLAQQLAQDARGRVAFDPDRALEPILTGLSREPQCLDETP